MSVARELLHGGPLEAVLKHTAWLAEVEREWPVRSLPLGWAFRVYNVTAVLRLRWHHAPELRALLRPTASDKLDKAIDKLLTAASKSIEKLRTSKGLAKARALVMPGAARKRVAELLKKLLGIVAKHMFSGPVPARREPEYEKQLPVEGLFGEVAAIAGTAVADERLVEYCRSIGAVIAVTGPKATVLSPRNRVLATQLATAALQAGASRLGSEYKRERAASKALVRSLRITTN